MVQVVNRGTAATTIRTVAIFTAFKEAEASHVGEELIAWDGKRRREPLSKLEGMDYVAVRKAQSLPCRLEPGDEVTIDVPDALGLFGSAWLNGRRLKCLVWHAGTDAPAAQDVEPSRS